MGRELWSLLFVTFRFLVGFAVSILGFMLMGACVWTLFTGINVISIDADMVHVGVAGLCLYMVGEHILDSVIKVMDAELEGGE